MNLEFSETARYNTHARWNNEPDDSKDNTVINVMITRGSANVLLGILAKSEHNLPMSDRDWQNFTLAAGEIIGAIWRAKD